MTINYDVIAIIGPTASGKTALSIRLAKWLDGEIINGDSMQVYEQLNIGTAKIALEEMEQIPHHLLDIKKPTESFSVAEFQQLVRAQIKDIQQRGKVPILVGGTGLYIQSVLYDFQFTNEQVNEQVRAEYEAELKKNGIEAMYQRLVTLDPETAATIHPNNTRRLLRALEMVEQSGTAKSSEQFHQGDRPLYNHVIIGMQVERERLYNRINQRVERMVEQGLIQEVQALYDAGIRDVQSVKAIGYKELYAYFDGDVTLGEAIANIQQNSRRYAKRQLTYFRNKMHIQWIGQDFEAVKQLLTSSNKRHPSS